MFSRLELLIGSQALQRLHKATVLLLGVGGVGSWAAETLVRSGIGHLTIADFDVVKESNINRQLQALHSTIGEKKVQAMSERLKDINPDLDLVALDIHLTPDNVGLLLDAGPWDYVIDAIDERAAKTALLIHCVQHGIPVISCMGAACKSSTEGIRVVDISETSGCHLARLVRKALHKAGIERGIPVVFSPLLPDDAPEDATADSALPEAPGERRPLGTVAYVPAAFGIKCAETVVKSIIGKDL